MVTTTQITKRKEELKGLLSKKNFQESLKQVLPRHMTPDRVVKMFLVAASRQPKLYECTDASLMKSLITSGELGLDCSGSLGQGWLVPYYNGKIKKTEAQFIPGYQGLVNLARRSGHILRIESRAVYEKDHFDLRYGLDQKLSHTPNLTGDRGKIVAVYAIAEMKDGSSQLEVMTIDEVERIRNRSKAKESGPWTTDFSEMARKTVIRRLCKYLPLSPEMEKALEADDRQFEGGFNFDEEDAGTPGVNGLKERLTKRRQVDSKVADEEEQPHSEDETPGETNAEPIEPDEGQCWVCLEVSDELNEKGCCPKCAAKGGNGQ